MSREFAESFLRYAQDFEDVGMRRERGVTQSEQAGETKQDILFRIDWQRSDAALSIYIFSIKTWQIFQPATRSDFRERVHFGKFADEFLPLRVLPPFRFFPQQMNSARESLAQSVCCHQRVRQSVRPRNHNPKLWLVCHRYTPRWVGVQINLCI